MTGQPRSVGGGATDTTGTVIDSGLTSEWRVWTPGLRRRQYVIGRWVAGKPEFALTPSGNKRRFSRYMFALVATQKLNEEARHG